MVTFADGSDKAALARLFSATSDSHDAIGTPLFDHFGELLVELVHLRPGHRVLDVAAGVGATLIPAARRIGAAGLVTGIDLAPGMIQRLAARIGEEGITNAEVALADGEALPFEDGSFDAVLCGFALFFFADPARAVEGFLRVLRPGGVLGVSTFTHDGSASIDRIWELLSRCVEVPPPADPERRFDDAVALTRVLRGAGFVGIDVRESPLAVVFEDVEAWWAWLRSMEFREALERMDEETARRFKASASEVFSDPPGAPAISFRMDGLLTRCQRP